MQETFTVASMEALGPGKSFNHKAHPRIGQLPDLLKKFKISTNQSTRRFVQAANKTQKLTEDNAFIRSLQSGDPSAYAALVKLYQKKVYNTCYSFLKHSEAAEDQTQEVFIIIFNSIGQFEEKSSLSTWIYRIAVSRCLDHLRSQNRKKRRSTGIFSLFSLQQEIPASNDQTPYQHLENKEYAQIISDSLDAMKDKYKTVFVLKYMEGLSQREIAAVIDSTEKAVEGILARSKNILKEALREYFPEMRENPKKNL